MNLESEICLPASSMESGIWNLESKGFYKIIEFPLNGKQISKLLIGPYKQRADAVALLPKVKKMATRFSLRALVRKQQYLQLTVKSHTNGMNLPS